MEYGSAMSILVHRTMTGSPEENLAVLWKDAQSTYDDLGVPQNKRFGQMHMNMFSKAGGHTLTNRNCDLTDLKH